MIALNPVKKKLIKRVFGENYLRHRWDEICDAAVKVENLQIGQKNFTKKSNL